MAKRTSKKIIHEADMQVHDVDKAPESAMQVHDVDQALESAMQVKETADEYIAREYGEAIRAGNVARMLEGILVEIVKWRMNK